MTRRKCGCCGRFYSGYTVLIKDDIKAYSKWVDWNEKYRDFCWSCFTEENPDIGVASID